MLKTRRMRNNPFLLTQERGRELLPHRDNRGKVIAIKAKAKVDPPKAGETTRPPTRQVRGHAFIATNQVT